MALRYDPHPGGGGLFGLGFKDRLDPQPPALAIEIGRQSYTPEQRFLSERTRALPWRWSSAATTLVAHPRHHSRLGRPRLRGGRQGVRVQPPIRLVPPSASDVGGGGMSSVPQPCSCPPGRRTSRRSPTPKLHGRRAHRPPRPQHGRDLDSSRRRRPCVVPAPQPRPANLTEATADPYGVNHDGSEQHRKGLMVSVASIDELELKTRVAEVLNRWPTAGLAVGVVRDGSPGGSTGTASRKSRRTRPSPRTPSSGSPPSPRRSRRSPSCSCGSRGSSTSTRPPTTTCAPTG